MSAQTCPVDAADEFRPYSPRMREDPYRAYAKLREERPVEWMPVADTGYWAVSRYADAMTVLRSPDFGAGAAHLDAFESVFAAEGAESRLPSLMRRWFLFQDPPEHTFLRGTVAHAFSPPAIRERRERIEGVVAELFEPLGAEGVVDVVPAFARPLPVRVIGELFGLPPEGSEELAAWSLALTRATEPFTTRRRLQQASDALDRWVEYFEREFTRRESEPSDDLLTTLLEEEFDGRRLTRDEVMATVVMMFLGGHESTLLLLTTCIEMLATCEGLRESLRADPDRIRGFVEEALRLESPIQIAVRRALRDVELGGRQLEQGDQVVVLVGSVNRDPDHFAEPDEMQVGREGRHLAFGQGVHYCVGAVLARLEAEVVVDRVVREFTRLEIVDPRPRRRPSFTGRGYVSLHVEYERRPRERQ